MKGFFTCDSLNNIWSGFGFKWRSIEWYEKELFKKPSPLVSNCTGFIFGWQVAGLTVTNQIFSLSQTEAPFMQYMQADGILGLAYPSLPLVRHLCLIT